MNGLRHESIAIVAAASEDKLAMSQVKEVLDLLRSQLKEVWQRIIQQCKSDPRDLTMRHLAIETGHTRICEGLDDDQCMAARAVKGAWGLAAMQCCALRYAYHDVGRLLSQVEDKVRQYRRDEERSHRS